MRTATVAIPEPMYRQLEQSATITHRSVDEVLIQTLRVALPPSPDLPEGLANELAEMLWMSDDSLRKATQPSMTKSEQKQLAALNHVADARELTSEEKIQQKQLLAKYEQSVLRRAQAFAILARRGHAIPSYKELSLN